MKINHITLLVGDKQTAEEFYTQVLGFEKVNVGKSLWIKLGKEFIHLSQVENFVPNNSFQHVSIEMDDLGSFINETQLRGAKYFYFNELDKPIKIHTEEVEKHRQFFIRDIDGNLLEFISSKDDFFHQTKES